ncbi:MAG TPA: polysaccharide biosynthesis/export family protein [Pyrinomonadaceae bacterium]
MKKVLLGVIIAAFAADVSAARPQTPSVRVGPAADESAPNDSAVAKKDDERATDKSGNSAKIDPKKNAKNSKTGDAGKSATERASNATPNPAAATAAPQMTSDATGATSERTTPPVNSPKVTPAPDKGSPAAGGTASPAGATSAAPGSASFSNINAAAPPHAPAPTSIYRVGVGDVLDIRLQNVGPRESTLFAVLAGGLIDYPLAGDPFNVAGMTTDEVGVRVAAELRRRAVYDKPQVYVSVREYGSHTVLVSGLVYDPGVKILRREAIPLYVLIAEAQPKPEAGRALVMSHSTGQSKTLDLSDTQGLNTLIHPSDVVNLVARPQEFFYIGGEISAPGQKNYHPDMTLTQALLASGGVTRTSSGAVRVSRQSADGRLVPATYDLRLIQEGKIPDPALQPGDRIEVEAAGKKKN